MPLRFLWLVAGLAGAGCSVLPPPVPTATELRYLQALEPAAALDSIAAWAAQSDDLGLERTAAGLIIRDRRPRQDNVATVTARSREDGLTEVTVASMYVFTSSARDLGIAAFLGGEAGFPLPRPESPSCFSLADWRQKAAAPVDTALAVEAASLYDAAPELVGGLAGLQRRLRYPESMRVAGIEGAVLVEFIVGGTGAVDCAQVLSSPHPDLSAAALEAVLASEFTPGTREGEPVSVRFVVPLSFGLR